MQEDQEFKFQASLGYLRLSLNEKGCRVRGSIPKYSNLLITRCFIRSLF